MSLTFDKSMADTFEVRRGRVRLSQGQKALQYLAVTGAFAFVLAVVTLL